MNRIEYKPITELLDCIIDNRGKSCPVTNSGIPLIATNCIKHSSIYPTFENIRYVSEETLKNWFRAELKPNDILFVNKGTPGRVCLVPDPITFCAAQDMIGLRCNPNKIYYKYLFAVLRSNFIQEKIRNFHVGIMIPHFKKSDMENLLIPLVNMKEQIKIGDSYCDISEKIENNNKICAELENMAKTLYDYWFVQFDFPDKNGKPYKTSGGKMIWNEELKREIPEGWEVKNIGDVIIERDKSNIPAGVGKDAQGCFPFFTSGDAIYSWKNELTNGNNCYLNTGGNPSIKHYIGKAAYSTDTWCITGKEALENYLYLLLKSWERNFESKFFAGTGLKHLQKPVLKQTKISIPCERIKLAFNSFANPLFEKVSLIRLENRELASLRDFLLPMLMNGQVTIK